MDRSQKAPSHDRNAKCTEQSSTGHPRPIGMRHVLANAILFIAYLAGICVGDWLDIRCFPDDTFVKDLLSVIGPVFVLSAIPVFCGINWGLTDCPRRPFRRAFIGCFLGLTVIAALFWPFVTLYLDFHTMIGGFK